MQKLYDRLGLPKTHYRMHQAVLAGLPVSLVADLAHELGLPLLSKFRAAYERGDDSELPSESE